MLTIKKKRTLISPCLNFFSRIGIMSSQSMLVELKNSINLPNDQNLVNYRKPIDTVHIVLMLWTGYRVRTMPTA